MAQVDNELPDQAAIYPNTNHAPCCFISMLGPLQRQLILKFELKTLTLHRIFYIILLITISAKELVENPRDFF